MSRNVRANVLCYYEPCNWDIKNSVWDSVELMTAHEYLNEHEYHYNGKIFSTIISMKVYGGISKFSVGYINDSA